MPQAYPAYVPAQQPKTPASAPRPKRSAVSRPQTGWVVLILAAALASILIGITYLSAHARVTAEAYRHDRLLAQRKQMQAKFRYLQQQVEVQKTDAQIEAAAQQMQMIRADEKQSVIVH